MNYKSLEITDEEKESLKKYCEWQYMYINLLISGDMDAILKFNNDQIDIFTPKYFKDAMKTLLNIYSAMEKSNYGSDFGIYSLTRGTTVAEVESLKGEYTKLLSTTTDELSAKQFAGSKVNYGYAGPKDYKPAIMRISVRDKNLPFINVNSVLGEESNHEREKEILLAPFGVIEKNQHMSSWDGYEFYSVEIKSQELQPLENKEDVEEYIIQNIHKIPLLIKQYTKYRIDLEVAEKQITMQQNAEDVDFIKERIEEISLKLPEIKAEFDEIRGKMVEYAKGICSEPRARIEKEVKEEEQNIQVRLQEEKENIKKILSANVVNVAENVDIIKQKNERYITIAKKLGLEWNIGISNDILARPVEGIENYLISMNSELDYGSLSEQEKSMKKYIQKTERIKGFCEKIEEKQEQYNDENCMDIMKSELNKKIDILIRNDEIKQLDEEYQKLKNEKPGFFDKILGKDKERELKIEQLQLRKELMQNMPITEQEEPSTHKMIAKIMFYEMKNNGNLPQELKVIPKQIKSVFKIDDTKVNSILDEMNKSVALIPADKTTNIFNRKNGIENLQQENEKLENDLKAIKKNNVFGKNVEVNSSDSIKNTSRFVYEQLNRICDVIEERNQTKDAMKLLDNIK